MSWGLTIEWARTQLAKGICPMTGITFEYSRKSPFLPTIYRIDSNKGYEIENCRVVCFAYNTLKNEWTDEVARKVAEGIVRAYA